MPDTGIAVVGGGIAGLTTALALEAAGLACAVFEQAAALPGGGGGIQLPPNASRVLDRLGLGPALDAVAVRPVARELRRWDDDTLVGRVELGAAAERRYGAPYRTLRRADLLRVLFERCAGAVRFGHRCIGVEEHRGGVELRFAGGARHRAGVVIGADGLHSAIRGCITVDDVRPSGHTVHRALVPAADVPWPDGPPRVLVWLGPGRHCVCYPVGDAVNVVVVVPAGTGLDAAREGWHPRVRELLAAARDTVHHGLSDRPPMPRWHRGRLAVIGDAAHPMLPFLAQGAAQAIEDAAAVAVSLGTGGGFDRFEHSRRARVDRVVAAVGAGDHAAPNTLTDHDWLYGC
ncbi:FAD-dependent monooxygenase [Dactylosporangium fulvum]|uniref:FAD-dependent monooxygenase n=1 Tax=Dactylosporangium fulvum TaxID=53359 RepID=A0ABY5VP19_9ACTN|nr:FAD-dependent monooxygenase [Dactylosporangium fulvum]UWP79487.1 FAD-dependent monooxygenase [Dactylosporangium fulvum]